MKTDVRRPENFDEFDGEEIMSNFDGEIIKKTLQAIKGKNLFSTYSGWNFNGKVWFELDSWFCEIWVYGCFKETFIEKSCEDIMENVSNKYGNA